MIKFPVQNIERGDGQSDAPARILKGGMGNRNASARILKGQWAIECNGQNIQGGMGDRMHWPKYQKGDGRMTAPAGILKGDVRSDAPAEILKGH